MVAAGVWSLQEIFTRELKQRRKILGLTNNYSNEQFKGKTAHCLSRPVANTIVDIIEKQQLLDSSSISNLKACNCYWKENKIATVKNA